MTAALSGPDTGGYGKDKTKPQAMAVLLPQVVHNQVWALKYLKIG